MALYISAVAASPSYVDARRIPRIALTASNSLPALVDCTALIFRVKSTFKAPAAISSHSPRRRMRSSAPAPKICCSMDTAIRQPSLAAVSPPICQNGAM